METNPMDFVESDGESGDDKSSQPAAKPKLNTLVAITVALLATFLAVCNVKDDNIVQQMQKDQADTVDTWAWFQARKTQLNVARFAVDQLQIQLVTAPSELRATIEQKISGYQADIAKSTAILGDLEKKATALEADYNRWNHHDDQFDLANGLLSVAIALLAVTSLTQKRWLFFVAMIPTAGGLIFGIAGLFQLGLHSDLFARWLGT